MKITKALQHKISKGRTRVIIRDPFFATILMDMDVELSETKTENVATDGERVYFNPDWLADASAEEVSTSLCKASLHTALAHPLRRRARKIGKWIAACDQAALNLMVNDKMPVPPGSQVNPMYSGMTAEEIYRLMEEQDDDNGDGQGEGEGQGSGGAGQQPPQGGQQDGKGDNGGGDQSPAPQPGHTLDHPADNAADLAEAERQNDQRNMRAQMAAKAAGKNTATTDKIAEEIRSRGPNWREKLLAFVDNRIDVDFGWKRPNRRFVHDDIYLPGAIPDGLSTLGIVLDSSVSIFGDPKTLAVFFSQIDIVREAIGIERVVIVHCDTAVKQIDVYGPGDEIPRKAKGGGGTNMRDGMKAIREYDPNAVICLTDGIFGELSEDPGAPTMFCLYGGNEKAPATFGQNVVIPPVN